MTNEVEAKDAPHQAAPNCNEALNRFSGLKDKLTERDLLKVCMEKPQYLSKALGHSDASTGLETVE